MPSQYLKVQILIYIFPSKIWLVCQLCKGLWLMRIWYMVSHQFWVMMLCTYGRKGTPLSLTLFSCHTWNISNLFALCENKAFSAEPKYYPYFICKGGSTSCADVVINWWIYLLNQILHSPPFTFFLTEYSCSLLTQW